MRKRISIVLYTTVVAACMGVCASHGIRVEAAHTSANIYNPVFNEAEALVSESGYTYELDENGAATITAYTGTGGVVIVPSVLDGHPVTAIGNSAFASHGEITELVLPDSVTSIGSSAFTACENLNSAVLPDGLTGIPSGMFEDCYNLKDVTIPATVTSIGDSAFYQCTSLENVILPEGLKSIGNYAFAMCENLNGIKLPESLTTMGWDVFSGCTALTGINVPQNLTSAPCAFRGAPNLKNIVLENGIKSIPESMFQECEGIEEITIPSSVKTIEIAAFDSCTNLKKVTFQDGVTDIQTMAFSLCDSLTDINLPESLTTMGWGVFDGCTSLVKIEIPKNLKSVEGAVFGGCDNLTDIKLEDGTTKVLSELYADSSVKKIVLPASVTEISKGAFVSCDNLTDITMYGGVVTIAKDIFADNDRITIHGVRYTYAQQYADENSIKFDAISDIPGAELKLSSNTKTVDVGGTFKIGAVITPEYISSKLLIWTSANEAVATVDADGNVKATGAGTTVITCKLDGNDNVSASCTIKVVVKASKVTLNKTTLSLTPGKMSSLTATVFPENATTKTVSWSSSNKTVATVSSSGKVTAVGNGTATITCTAKDGSGKKASCKVTVKTPATGLTLSKTALTINTGKTSTLKATVAPDTVSNRNVTWKSSNTKVATVDASGVVTALKAGTATITCTTADGSKLSTTCAVTVKQLVTSVKLGKSILALKTGKTYTLTTTVSPEDATNPAVKWTTSDATVAKVSSTGKVTAVGNGTATITCTAKDGSSKEASCEVTVTTLATGITLNKTTATIKTGKTSTLKATVAPSTASNKKVTWKSSNTKVATVDTNGVVTAVKAGTATITCTAKDGSGVKTTCAVTVKQPVTGIRLSKSTLTLLKGKSSTLTKTVSPSDASNKAVTWSSSDKSIATVDANGKVTAVKTGTVTITCKAKDGSGIKSTCKVTVKQPVTKITLGKTKLTLKKGKTATLTKTVAPTSAASKKVTWRSADTSIATVDANGKVTAKKAGTVKITCTAADGSGVKATCTVTVTK